MTKILYIVGEGSTHDDIELKWSLRSVDKYALDQVEPVIAGRIPKWFKGSGIETADKTNRKEKNIMEKILTAAECGLVEGEFQISADDHFWIKPTEFWRLPILYRQIGIPECGEAGNNYAKALSGTRETLMKNGITAINTTCHCNAWCHADDAPEVEKLVSAAEGTAAEYGLVSWAVWPNLYIMRKTGRPIDFRNDLKYGSVGHERFKRETKEAICFSINDDAFDSPCVMSFLESEFSGKSKWEK